MGSAAVESLIAGRSSDEIMDQPGGMNSVLINGLGIGPNHSLFHDAQLQYAAALAGTGPVLVDRTNIEAGDVLQEDISKIAQEGVEEEYSEEVFSSFRHKEIIPGCLPHPGDIVEAGSLADLAPAIPPYPLSESLPSEIITGGKLSSLQLEGIILACQRHLTILPNGNRAGFFIGDAAGVGKGRQISGIILDNFSRGRTKHIWFSISTDLVVDARRDLTDIGCHVKVIEGCQQLDKETRVLGLPKDFKEGVIFSTYATLVSSVSRGGVFNSTKTSRLQQLVDWCGGVNFDGCLIFDECHKAKNFVPGKETASTKVAMAVAHIQRMLPKARVLYCSATGVSDVKNMAFMERLGLWGEGAPFKSFQNFIETVQRKGLGVAEMLAMEMKSSGMYLSRGLSYKQAEFMTVEIELTEEQQKMYDTAAHVWNELRKALVSAMSRTNSTQTRMWSAFWGAHQRFFKQLCLGLKVPRIVEEAKKAMDDGCCIVIGLQTTGEASMESVNSKTKQQLTGFVSLCREILRSFIQQHFPTMIENQLDPAAPQVEDEWSATAKQMLCDFSQTIALPNSPLDDLIDLLGGPSNVAEMTGRRSRIVRHHPSEAPRYESREADSSGDVDSLNVQERNHFMAGRKLVAIISDAASTGISLHSDQRVANQRRRVHMTIELPWSADKAVQQLGRSHRSNQSSGPLYKLATTNLGGEKRFAASVARRLQSLGALTKGDRRAATGVDLKDFNFDTPYGRASLRAMYTAICQNTLAPGLSFSSISNGSFEDFTAMNNHLLECLTKMDVIERDVTVTGFKVADKESNDVGKFLNRILGLKVKNQQLMFSYFSQLLDVTISNARKEGRYNEGLVDILASSVQIVGEPREVFEHARKGNNPTKHIVLKVDRGISWETALQRLQDNPGPNNSFYRSNRDMWGKRLLILATVKEGSPHLFKITRPSTGVSAFEEESGDLFNKYSAITVEEAEAGWREQYEHSNDHCIHGPKCKTGAACTVGSRCYRIHLLTGGIVTLMNILELAIARYGPKLQLTKAESTLRVVRAKLDSGERVIGMRYPEMLIPMANSMLKEQELIERVRTQQLAVSQGGDVKILPSSVASIAQSEEEDVSPVIQRLLTKAITPPVTIKNFFKPKGKAAVAAPKPKANCDINVVKSESTSSVTESSDLEKRESKDESVSDRQCDRTLARATSSPASNKRTLSDADGSIGNPSKRAKQVNIMASFGKQKSIHDERGKKGLLCPICKLEFAAGTSNTEINTHVDNCLIE